MRNRDVVRCHLALLAESRDRQVHRDPRRRPRKLDFLRHRRKIVRGKLQRTVLGIGQQPVPIHGDAVAVAEEQMVAGLRRGLGDGGHGDGLENLDHGGHGTLLAVRVCRPAQ